MLKEKKVGNYLKLVHEISAKSMSKGVPKATKVYKINVSELFNPIGGPLSHRDETNFG